MEDFWDNTCVEGERRGGGRISCHQKSIKGDYRILTADGEGGLIARILESLIGESGKFYLDIAQILQPTPPPPLLFLGDKKAVYVSSTFLTRTFFFYQFPQGVQPDEESVRIFVEFQRVESAIKGILTQFLLKHQNKPSISSVCFITNLFRKPAPSSQPIRRKAETNRDMVIRVFPR